MTLQTCTISGTQEQIASGPAIGETRIESSMRNLPSRVLRYADEISFWHGVGPRDIFSRTRLQPIATARADLMRRLRHDRFSYTQIGRWLQRDHTTVLHHVGAAK